MKFNTIIFDLDGTIADTLPLCIAAFKQSDHRYFQHIGRRHYPSLDTRS